MSMIPPVVFFRNSSDGRPCARRTRVGRSHGGERYSAARREGQTMRFIWLGKAVRTALLQSFNGVLPREDDPSAGEFFSASTCFADVQFFESSDAESGLRYKNHGIRFQQPHFDPKTLRE